MELGLGPNIILAVSELLYAWRVRLGFPPDSPWSLRRDGLGFAEPVFAAIGDVFEFSMHVCSARRCMSADLEDPVHQFFGTVTVIPSVKSLLPGFVGG